MNMTVFYGILIPFSGTVLGSACVFFMKNKLNEKLQKALTGMAAGVMVAALIAARGSKAAQAPGLTAARAPASLQPVRIEAAEPGMPFS